MSEKRVSGPVFLITDTRVINAAKYHDYHQALLKVLLEHGGRILASDQAPQVVEGDWRPTNMMIVEFAGIEAVRACHASDACQAALALSHNCAMVDMVLVEGLKSARHAGKADAPAYAVADSHVVNRARFQELSQSINDAVHRYQGRHLAWSDSAETLGGNWAPPLLTLLEFPDHAAALGSYQSDEYRKTHELLANAAMINLLLLRGVGADGS